MNTTLKKRLKAIGIRLIAWPVAIMVLVCSCADRMIFHPPQASYTAQDGIIKIPVTSDESIAAIWRPAGPDSFILLFSHGNAEDIGQNDEFIERANAHGFGVLAYDYRGYGLSDGKPGQKNTYRDIEAAYRYLTDTLHVPPQRILIHGRSVGSGPSVWLAAQKPAGGLILESAFVSAFRVVTKYPILPFSPYPNLSRMKDIDCPVLVIHGRQDEVVAFWHGEKLFAAAHEPKMNYWVDDAGHNDLLWVAGSDYWKTLEEYVQTIKTTADSSQTGK